LLVNPYNVNEITDAIYKILTNEKLKNNLVKKGFERAKMFSWKKMTEETLKIYEKVLK